jgi:hypothetical protein
MICILLHNNESTAVLGAESVSWSSLKGQIGSQLSCTKMQTNSKKRQLAQEATVPLAKTI